MILRVKPSLPATPAHRAALPDVAQTRSTSTAGTGLSARVDVGHDWRDFEGTAGEHLRGGMDVMGELAPPLLTTPFEAIAALEGTRGWSALGARDQERLKHLVGGATNGLSAMMRTALSLKLGGAQWPTLGAAAQAQALRTFMTDKKVLPKVSSVVLPAARQTETYALRGPLEVIKEHPFRGKMMDAERYEVAIDGKATTVFAPHDPQATTAANGQRYGALFNHTPEQTALAIAQLPRVNRELIHTLTLSPVQNPDDAYWAKEYNMPDFRSYMTCGAAGDVTIYPLPHEAGLKQMRNSILHETGHAFSLGRWGHDLEGPEWKLWRDAMAEDALFLSAYAQASPMEDVSEITAVYQATYGTAGFDEYRAMFPARFAVLDTIFGGAPARASA